MEDEVAASFVMCCDIDAFFCQAEQLRDPQLAGRPIAIQQLFLNDKGPLTRRTDHQTTKLASLKHKTIMQHADIIAANYLAKLAGVRKRMTPQQARSILAPINGAVVHAHTSEGGRVSYQPYIHLSKRFFDVLRSLPWAHVVEKGSIDEAYILVNAPETEALELATRLRNQVQEQLNLTVSIGVASNKLLAKLASRRAKPPTASGISLLFELSAIQQVLDQANPATLPGFGGKTASTFDTHGLNSVTDLQRYSLQQLTLIFDLDKKLHTAEQLYNWCRGLDPTPVKDKGPPKSLSVQMSLTPISIPMHASVGGVSVDGQSNGRLEPLLIGAADFRRRVGALMAAMGGDLEERVREDEEEYGRRPTKLTVQIRAMGAGKDASFTGRSCNYPRHANVTTGAQQTTATTSASPSVLVAALEKLTHEAAANYPTGAKLVELRLVAAGFESLNKFAKAITKFFGVNTSTADCGDGGTGRDVAKPDTSIPAANDTHDSSRSNLGRNSAKPAPAPKRGKAGGSGEGSVGGAPRGKKQRMIASFFNKQP